MTQPTVAFKIATGRRKTSTARVRFLEGTGKIMVNGKTLDEYFGGLLSHKKDVMKPIELFPAAKGFDYIADVKGGGQTGQAGALRHSIARAIIVIDPKMRSPLKKAGLLTRDSRMVERKKPGRPKARKRFQFSKR